MRVRVTVTAVVAVLLLSGVLAGCAPVQSAPEPVSESTPAPSTPETLEPPSARPALVVPTTCDQLAGDSVLSLLRDGFVPRAVQPATAPDALWGSAAEFAGALTCEWSNGQGTFSVLVVPAAEPAWRRIKTEFVEYGGEPPAEVPDPVRGGCESDCVANGFVGEYFVDLVARSTALTDEGMDELISALAGSVEALPPSEPLPPIVDTWTNGPTSCEEFIPAELLATSLGSSTVGYEIGYWFDGSQAPFVALLSAGGFRCDVVADDGPGGTITVLPGAVGALDAWARTRPAQGDSPELSGVAPGEAAIECAMNGDWSDTSTNSCRLSFAAADAWVMAELAAVGGTEDALADRTVTFAAAVKDAIAAESGTHSAG